MVTKIELRPINVLCVALLVSTLTGCAINDSGNKSTALPITLPPPAALTELGICSDTTTLEDWLQITVPARQQFQRRLNEAAAKNAADVHDDTLYLASFRDAVARATTPDCGVEVQRVLVTSMTGAVAALQGYFNHTLSGDLTSALAEPQKGLDQAAAIQDELVTRMKNQYQAENSLPATPKS